MQAGDATTKYTGEQRTVRTTCLSPDKPVIVACMLNKSSHVTKNTSTAVIMAIELCRSPFHLRYDYQLQMMPRFPLDLPSSRPSGRKA